MTTLIYVPANPRGALKINQGRLEMVQQLRALAILAKDWGLFPAPTTRFTNICSSNFWGFNALFRTQKVYTHTCRKNTQVNKVNLKKCLKKKKNNFPHPQYEGWSGDSHLQSHHFESWHRKITVTSKPVKATKWALGQTGLHNKIPPQETKPNKQTNKKVLRPLRDFNCASSSW